MSRRALSSDKIFLAQRRKDAKRCRVASSFPPTQRTLGGKKTVRNAPALCVFAPLREKYLLIFLIVVTLSACRGETERGRVPTEVQEVVATVGDQMAQERYEQIYNESSDLWKKDATLEQSNQVFKTLREKLGKVESRSLHSATEQQNSGGTLKGHVFILSYQTRFERGDGMETFTVIEENGRWLLARYFVNSTALK